MTEFVLSRLPIPAQGLPEGDARCEATLALFGHDLRAALSDVVGGLRLIDFDALDPLNRVQIDRVRASAEALAQLLEQGLAVMLGEAPAVQLQHLNLQRFLTELDLRWSGRALEKGIAFSVHKGPDLPARLQVDRVALDRVLSNLLGNAFKYGERGRVVCEVAKGADGGLRVTVRDNGPGFPSSVLDHSLPLHNRPNGMTEAGSGMGLHIAADLAHRLGGRLTLRNLAPSGAEARLDLPPSVSVPVLVPVSVPVSVPGAAQGSASGAQPLKPAETQMILDGRRVLIADDNPTSQSLATRLATGLGAEVVVVGDGVEAIGRLEREAFDLLIVDVEMPRLSGLDVIRCLRKLPGAVARMPVIAVTAFGLPSNREAILAAGANDLLTKPLLCPQAFANAVRGLLFSQSPLAPTPQTPAMDLSQLDRLLEMAGPETGRDLLDRLIGDLGVVRRGLGKASPVPDWDAVRSHSHVLISLAGAVGGVQLQAEAEALNQIGHRMDRAALDGLLPDAMTHLDAMIEAIRQVRLGHDLGRTP